MNRRNNFDVRYEGPFKVIKQIGRKTFIVQRQEVNTIKTGDHGCDDSVG